MDKKQNFEENFFKTCKPRVKIYPSGGSYVNSVLSITIQSEDQNESIDLEIRGVQDYYTYMDFNRILAASFIVIEWLEEPEEGAYFISTKGKEQQKPCFIKIIE